MSRAVARCFASTFSGSKSLERFTLWSPKVSRLWDACGHTGASHSADRHRCGKKQCQIRYLPALSEIFLPSSILCSGFQYVALTSKGTCNNLLLCRKNMWSKCLFIIIVIFIVPVSRHNLNTYFRDFQLLNVYYDPIIIHYNLCLTWCPVTTLTVSWWMSEHPV